MSQSDALLYSQQASQPHPDSMIQDDVLLYSQEGSQPLYQGPPLGRSFPTQASQAESEWGLSQLYALDQSIGDQGQHQSGSGAAGGSAARGGGCVGVDGGGDLLRLALFFANEAAGEVGCVEFALAPSPLGLSVAQLQQHQPQQAWGSGAGRRGAPLGGPRPWQIILTPLGNSGEAPSSLPRPGEEGGGKDTENLNQQMDGHQCGGSQW